MERRLVVQVQADRAEGREAEIFAALRAVADGLSLQFAGEVAGDDNGPYVNFSYTLADDGAGGWTRLRELYDELPRGRALARSSIVTCEGAHGWADYLLLHHYDSSVALDQLA